MEVISFVLKTNKQTCVRSNEWNQSGFQISTFNRWKIGDFTQNWTPQVAKTICPLISTNAF
jgi:hypothetical protein